MDEAELLALPVLDKAATFDRLDGDQELFRELVEIFRVDGAAQTEQLRVAITAGNADEAYRVAHGIKGALGNIGAMRCHRMALEIERQGKAGVCDAELFARLEILISEFLAEVG